MNKWKWFTDENNITYEFFRRPDQGVNQVGSGIRVKYTQPEYNISVTIDVASYRILQENIDTAMTFILRFKDDIRRFNIRID
jgi:hypothetical protein